MNDKIKALAGDIGGTKNLLALFKGDENIMLVQPHLFMLSIVIKRLLMERQK